MKCSMFVISAISVAAIAVSGEQVQKKASVPVNPNLTKAVALPMMLLSPEAALVRINGTRGLTEKVFPVMAEKSGQLTKDIDKIDVANYEAKVLGFGGRVTTWVKDLKLRVPIEADDLKAGFKNAADNKVRIDSTYNFNKASLKLEFHVKSQANTPLDFLTPDFVKKMLQLNDTFFIELKGVSGVLNLTGKKQGNGVIIESVNDFSVQLGNVSITDSGVLTEIADALLGLDKLFNVVGATNTNQAATKLVNKLLSQNLGLENRIKAAANGAIGAISTAQFTNQNLPLAPVARMNVAATFQKVDSQVNNVVSNYAIAVEGSPDNKVPSLTFSTPLRPTEDITLPNSAGDVQAFVPYSLIDKAMFEAIQAGLLKSFNVPASGGLTNAFTMQLTPTQAPRSNKDPNSTRNVMIEFAARMEDVTVGTVRIPGAPTAGIPNRNLDITTVNATANVAILCQVKADDRSGIYIDIVNVVLNNLTGNLRVGPTLTDLAPHKNLIQNIITSQMKAGLPRLTLMSRTMDLVAPLRVQVGSPSLGTKYVRIPLTITN